MKAAASDAREDLGPPWLSHNNLVSSFHDAMGRWATDGGHTARCIASRPLSPSESRIYARIQLLVASHSLFC